MKLHNKTHASSLPFSPHHSPSTLLPQKPPSPEHPQCLFPTGTLLLANSNQRSWLTLTALPGSSQIGEICRLREANDAGFTQQSATLQNQSTCPQSNVSPSNETISAELWAELPSGWDRLRRRPHSAVGPPTAHSTRFGLIDFVIARLIEQLQQHYQEKVSGLGRGVGGCGGGRGIGAGERAKWVFPFLLRWKQKRRQGAEFPLAGTEESESWKQ